MGRKRIGLVYRPSSNWIGGAYYVQNIIMALKTLNDKRLPQISIFCNSDEDFDQISKYSHYPYLRKRLINPYHTRLYWFFEHHFPTLKNWLYGDPSKFPTRWDREVLVYPFSDIENVEDTGKVLCWIPDFQEKYLRSFFKEEELSYRNKTQKDIVGKKAPIVFSSNDALNDFYKFHPEGRNQKTFVLPFAVTHPDFSGHNISDIRAKYGIEDQYLFCANQFWKHKNHLFLFEAYAKAKKQGLKCQLVCSGKLYDYRDDSYCQEIINFIETNDLKNSIKILGFIDREEQLCLMKNSYAVVQPSLFEGWSTVVEDAKCLNKFIFLSDLRVHQEQSPANVCYFDPYTIDDLVEKLLNVVPTKTEYDYQINVSRFAETFMKIIETLS